MLQPTWLVDILAGIMLATSTYGVARLLAARFWGRALHRDVNIAHVAMGLAMAGMLVAAFRTLPNGVWELVFGALIVWFGLRAALLAVGQARADTHHLSHNLTHMVMAGAMFYMFMETSSGVASARAGATMSAMGGAADGASDLGGLTLLFAFILFASAVWHADGLTRYTTARRQLAVVGASVTAATVTATGTDVGAFAARTTPETTPDEEQTEQSHWLAPRLEMGCHIAMCITMGYMLVLLLS